MQGRRRGKRVTQQDLAPSVHAEFASDKRTDGGDTDDCADDHGMQ